MPQVPISGEQLQKLQGLVQKLSDDKDAADSATYESSLAHVALQAAQTDVATKDQAEADLDEVVSGDLSELVSFVDGLISPTAGSSSPK